MTPNQSELTARLRRRLETERLEIEETAAHELRKLDENLNAVAKDALSTIEADTASATGRFSAVLMRAWILPLAMGLSLFLAVSGGCWATMHWLSTSIQRRITTFPAVNVEIEQARETLAQLEETWGVTLREIDGERFTESGSWCCRPSRWTIRPGPWASGLP